ncbi:DUF2637 domain-containing protein [Streptomyces sp. NPDC091271]|uniref:DUF2637 domain-containing protein n=1 Tax=Streptomyces sp. NPDC091271 TaxID=3365980 RepID=UPI00382454D9
MTRPTALTALAGAAAAVIVALTAAAFWLSYEHLHDLARGYGLDGARAWAWPATVDLFIVAGELLMLRAALERRTDPWAVGLTASGSLGSIALNVAAVGTGRPVLEYVVAAVPPVAALLAFGALMRQVHERLAVFRPAKGVPAVLTAPVAVPAVPEAHPDPLTARVRREYADGYPSVRELKARYAIGQARAQRIRDGLAAAV